MDDRRPETGKIREQDLVGFKYFTKILRLLERLHATACQRDRAANRILHYDQHLALILLYFFNPILTSLRGIVQASALGKVQRKLGVPRASLGSLSEAHRVFDSALLLEIIGELAQDLRPIAHDARLDEVRGILTLVDGTLLTALPKLVEAMWLDEKHKAFRLLFQAILDARSSFVCRVRDNSVFEVLEDRAILPAARAAGIVSDRIVHLGCDTAAHRPPGPLRLIEIRCTVHRKRLHGARGGPEQGEVLLIATDLLDLPAEVIALIYQQRWAIEIFFRFFKHVLGCRHLLAHNANGIQIQTYSAIIACLLIALWTGKKPTLRTYEMICFYFAGWASEEELDAHIARLSELRADIPQN